MTTSCSKINCGPITVSGDFDSGNVLKAELIYPPSESDHRIRNPKAGPSSSSPPVAFQLENQDYEINIWTRPDCHGTLYENGNRTWFHFGINGGKSNGVVKINIVNLNKQNKLFLQGMQPVYRILPDRPKWERIDDRIVINENKPQDNNGCNISFRIKLPENTYKSTLLIAFTYPFGYLELCDLLKDLDNEFLNKVSKAGPKAKLNRRELSQPDNDIYYHRECVCYSLENRRVDLLTITSVHGISDKREDRLSNLFPLADTEPRPFKFPSKKVVFLSARVHPGETPSSFVLNGFLRFIMHKTDPRAVILRRLFVFKFIPILNPDGVFKGNYRTDPRGVNLNRVYLSPSARLHPSIYAARKLLIYYHCGIDAPDDEDKSEENNCLQQSDDSECIDDCDNNPIITKIEEPSCSSNIELFSEDTCFDPIPGSSNFPTEATASSSKKPYTFVLSDANSICAGCVPLDSVAKAVSSKPPLNELFGGSSHQCAFEACDEDSVYYENLKLNDPVSNNNSMEIDQHEHAVGLSSDIPSVEKKASRSQVLSPRRKKRGASAKDKRISRSNSAASELPPKDKRIGSGGVKKQPKENSATSSGIFSGMKWPFEMKSPSRMTRSHSQKSGIISSYKSTTSRYYDSSSGLFLYVDMHGHTTKRGIFMYGNHFPEVGTQAECMLVPRIMAINSPHFDFAACNFTERLMCCKDKKDGMSREGSGRVACLKLTGLVRSYTLECNYNTGRIVNPVVSRASTSGFFEDSTLIFQPPKFTIELFEQVGRSLAETLLDMSGQNPYSRLSSTEFKTIEGVKRSLVNRLKLSPEFKDVPESSLGVNKNPTNLDPNGNSNSLLKAGPLSKINRKLKSSNKVLTPSQSGGPLGPKNSSTKVENAKPPSVSQTSKTLPKKQLLSSEDNPIASSSSASLLAKTAILPKSNLTRVLKSRTFPRVSSATKKGKVRAKKASSKFNTLTLSKSK